MAITPFLTNQLKYHLLVGEPWSLIDLRAMLVSRNAWVPNIDDDFVVTATVAGAVELTTVGYARQTLTNFVPALDDTNDWAGAHCDAFTFPAMTAGDTYDTMIVFRHVTNDSDSWIAAIYDLGGTQTTTVMSVRYAIDPAGLFVIK